MITTNFTLNELQIKIEKLRQEMVTLGLRNGFKCSKTINVSQKLDKYIAKYQGSNRI